MEASEEPELIGVGSTETIETEVRRNLAGGGKALAALLVLGIIGFLVFSSGPKDSESADEKQEIGDEDAAPVTTTTPPRTSSSSRRTTTTRNIAEQLSPVFNFDTGWDLFIGDEGSTLRFKIDSGQIDMLPEAGIPMAVVGEYLVTASPRTDSVSFVSMTSLTDQPAKIPGARPIYGPQAPVVADIQDGRIWLLSGPWEAQVWQLWELGDKPVLIRELEAPQNNFGPTATHPKVIGASSGGVFVYEGDQITKVADGRLMTVTQTHAVVEQCESPFTCETVWFELDSWEVDTGIRSPQVQNSYFLFLMVASPDAKHAFVFDYSDSRTGGVLWNLETGEAQFDGFVEEGAAFSPDGRFAAGFLTTGNLGIVNTETGELVEVDLPGSRGYGRVVFAPAN